MTDIYQPARGGATPAARIELLTMINDTKLSLLGTDWRQRLSDLQFAAWDIYAADVQDDVLAIMKRPGMTATGARGALRTIALKYGRTLTEEGIL